MNTKHFWKRPMEALHFPLSLNGPLNWPKHIFEPIDSFSGLDGSFCWDAFILSALFPNKKLGFSFTVPVLELAFFGTEKVHRIFFCPSSSLRHSLASFPRFTDGRLCHNVGHFSAPSHPPFLLSHFPLFKIA